METLLKTKNFRCMLSFTLMLLLFPCVTESSQLSQQWVAQGRGLMFNHGDPSMDGVIAAKNKFQDALVVDSSDQEAALFLSVARMVALMDDATAYTSGMPIETIHELFDILGVSQDGRDLFDWTAAIPEDINGNLILPEGLPAFEDLQLFFESVIIAEIDAAIANLSIVTQSFSTRITADEMGDVEGAGLELDYGDVALYQSGLYALKATLQILNAYNLNVNDLKALISKLENETFDFNGDLLQPHPDFLKLLQPDEAMSIAASRSSLNSFIDSYLAASEFIRGETDDQSDDLLTFEAEDLDAELDFRTELENVQVSLQNNTAVAVGDEESVTVDFSEFFNDPMDLRGYLPTVSQDPVTHEWFDVDICSTLDTTFSGVLPNGLEDCDLDSGYALTSELRANAVLEVSGAPVTLVWKMVGADITPSGDQVVSGYFYADPDDFAYGSLYNPELFVKIYIATNGWCNMAFNHVTVDNVSVYSMSGGESKSSTATLSTRLVEHQYNGVAIDTSLQTTGDTAAASKNEGYALNSGLWAKAVLQPSTGSVNLIWKEVGTDTTPSGDTVVSGYFYASPDDFAYGSLYNPEVFVKVYIASNGWANMAFNHVTVDGVDISTAHNYAGAADQSVTATLESRLVEHQYDGVGLQ